MTKSFKNSKEHEEYLMDIKEKQNNIEPEEVKKRVGRTIDNPKFEIVTGSPKEETLSDKRNQHGGFRKCYFQEDVKQFIKRLKEEAIEVPDKEGIYNGDEAVPIDQIDKLAGAKLI